MHQQAVRPNESSRRWMQDWRTVQASHWGPRKKTIRSFSRLWIPALRLAPRVVLCLFAKGSVHSVIRCAEGTSLRTWAIDTVDLRLPAYLLMKTAENGFASLVKKANSKQSGSSVEHWTLRVMNDAIPYRANNTTENAAVSKLVQVLQMPCASVSWLHTSNQTLAFLPVQS